MKWYRKQINSLVAYFSILGFTIGLLLIIATLDNPEKVIVTNINTIKSVEASKIVPISNNIFQGTFEEPKYIKVFSVTEINNNKDKKIEFDGTLTGYGPDCIGCGGTLACPPNSNVRGGNIYYEDDNYGKIRILAADPSIPCGSIVKISNYTPIGKDFYGIVLDRGSDIQGLTMDLLYESENEVRKLGRTYNINFKLERWGY